MNGQRVQRGGRRGGREPPCRNRPAPARPSEKEVAHRSQDSGTREPVGTRTQPRAQGTELEKGAGAHPEAALLSEAGEAAVTRGHSPARLSRPCPCHLPGDKSPNRAVPVP